MACRRKVTFELRQAKQQQKLARCHRCLGYKPITESVYAAHEPILLGIRADKNPQVHIEPCFESSMPR